MDQEPPTDPGKTNRNASKTPGAGISELKFTLLAPHRRIGKGPRGYPISASRREVEGHRVWVQDIDGNREELQVTQW